MISLVTGMFFGAVIGLVLFCYLVPGGVRVIGMYRFNNTSKQALRNHIAMSTFSSTTNMNMDSMKSDTNTTHPYMTGQVTSEKQFLNDMKLHHEAAVIMAKQVLTIKGIHPEVTQLAEDIIGAQTNEIKMMSNWLSAWK